MYILFAVSLLNRDWSRLHSFMAAMMLTPVLVDMNDHATSMDLA